MCTSRDGRFIAESFVLPCNQASLLQINTKREYFLSEKAMQKRIKAKKYWKREKKKSKGKEKKKLSFTVLFIILL